jgi:hypothetical protein
MHLRYHVLQGQLPRALFHQNSKEEEPLRLHHGDERYVGFYAWIAYFVLFYVPSSIQTKQFKNAITLYVDVGN